MLFITISCSKFLVMVVKMVEIGDNAPDFSLEGSDGKPHTLREFGGKRLVLYFYPKDDTPGCTTEAKCFNGSINEIRKLGAEVVGISTDSIESHGKFKSKYNLGFLLLSDTGGKTVKAYDSYGSRGIFGNGTLRKTYIIGKDGKIEKIFDKVKPDSHDREIIAFLKEAK